jgi:hypothetical protein
MFWNRIFLGVVGLFCAFSAGGKLQLWIDEGKVWRKPKNGFSRLLSYDEEPFLYVTEIGFYILVTLVGLLFVWLALGGSLKWMTRK